jgi:hypothetical protein
LRRELARRAGDFGDLTGGLLSAVNATGQLLAGLTSAAIQVGHRVVFTARKTHAPASRSKSAS